ncbi:MAG TPA: hypothetical protein QGF58_04235 [Myxococcota bacterium]|nr:hypothetical protein [Myxococcota bacterium]
MAALTPAQSRLLKTLTDTARRTGNTALTPPACKGVDDVQEWIGGARKALKEAQLKEQQAQAIADAQLAAAQGRSGSEPDWKRLDDACRRVEQELTKPSTLRSRLDEGRRSMMPRVEKVIRERLDPEVLVVSGRLEASVNEEGIRLLKQELPKWVQAWGTYAYGWLDEDLARLIRREWSPREGNLPIRAPRFAPLQPPAIDGELDLPTVVLDQKESGLGSGMYKYGRTILYGFMSIGLLFGVNIRGGSSDAGAGTFLAAIVVFMAALAFGFVQTQNERRTQRDKLAEDVRKKAEQGVRESLRIWLDRSADKINEDAQRQLESRRGAFVAWYRKEVIPARDRRAKEHARHAAQAEDARKALPRIRDNKRDLGRVGEALDALAAATGDAH